ncbi:hypothetical protein GOQ27_06900 [Clostridium sp. D2Q-11]|uniref:Uncharacterized protein n=1 Tax=Anaeromonas frigoriresistens TaxID=2683708 RepID=A0A942US14_9FIRM|nr:hypothetical protein [Anaeromonas frigoriresistens]MBS4538184.1 hypothetical protein [Anaeromonas frigoriresistens]
MIVEEYKLGNTTIQIDDEFIDESKTEEILERIRQIAINSERKVKINEKPNY